MFRHDLLGAELAGEFKKLQRGIELSSRASAKIATHLARRARFLASKCFWLFFESPQLWKSIGPDRKREFGQHEGYGPWSHPPSSKWF